MLFFIMFVLFVLVAALVGIARTQTKHRHVSTSPRPRRETPVIRVTVEEMVRQYRNDGDTFIHPSLYEGAM